MKNTYELGVKDKKLCLNEKCANCGSEKSFEIPKDEYEFIKSCGADDNSIIRIYKEYKLDNCYFYSFVTFKCDICGKPRVLGWEAGNSPSSHEVIHPSEEIDFWPNYDYPRAKIRICKWCMPNNDDKNSRKLYIKNLYKAMLKEEDKNWKWKTRVTSR